MRNTKFKKIVKEYFDLFVKKYPEYGSFLGLHQYDGQWSEQTRERYLDNIKFFKTYLDKFKKIDSKSLSPEEKLDRKIIIHQIRLSVFYLQELRFWQSDPDVLEEIGSVLFLLLIRETISYERRINSINRGLRDLPKIFEQTKSRLIKPYKLWTEIAIQSCQAMELFLKNLKNLKLEKKLKTQLERNIKIAQKAIKDYKNFLEKEILPKSIDKYIIGKEKFAKLIKYRELDLTTKNILNIGKETLKKDKKLLKEIAKEIDPNLKLNQVKEKIKKEHPKNFAQALKKYKESVAKARKFITDNHLMKIPANEKVLIKKTPDFLAQTTPFAAYFAPTKFDKKMIGIYTVTSPFSKKILEKHNFSAIANTSVHEAYPGHHLQFVWQYRNPSLVRTLADSTEFIEGWAHYCEEYMTEIGYNDKNEIRFIQVLDEIWRAARIIIDIKLHSGQMTFSQAVKFLIQETGMEKENAVAEIKRYTKSPGYQLSYLIGKYLIKELKKDIKKKMGKKYSDRFFHQVILEAGGIPIKYLRQGFELKMKNEV